MLARGAVICLLASGATAHVAAFAKGMYCKGGNNASIDDANTNVPVVPLYNLPFEQFWMQRDRGCDKVPPPNGESLELPAGGKFMVELAHNRGQTTLSFGGQYASDWPDGSDHPEDWHGANAGDCLSDGLMHAQSKQTASGTVFAISYNSDIAKVNLTNLVVFSVAPNTPWKRETWYDVPSDMPPCPSGGCHCAFAWVPNGCGIQNVYLQPFRCHVTGSKSTKVLGVPKAPVWCGDNQSQCVKGPKQVVVWHQQSGDNVFPPSGATPAYNGKMGFNPGAQTDIFVGSESNTPPPAAIAKLPSYLGCYADTGNPRTLAVTPQIGESMTPEVCLQKCTQMGYKYAGLEDGYECWCGQTVPDPSSKLAESQCSKQCTGSVQTCGGLSRIELYSTGVTGPLPPPPPLPASWEALGCFYDPITPRTLSNKQSIPGNNVTVASCLAACNDFTYAGLEFGSECYCGNSLDATSQAPDTDCNIPCAGDSSSLCGSNARLNVFNHTTAGSPPQAITIIPSSTFTTSTTTTTKPTTSSASTSSSSKTSPTTTVKPATPTPTTVTMLYACQAVNWGQPCRNFRIPHSSSCVSLADTGYSHKIRSAGPDTGKCVLYSTDDCTGAEKWELEYPGVATFGSSNAHWGSVKCTP